MWLTNLAIKRPVVILMLFVALAVLGIKSRSEMPLDLNPKVDIPYVVVSTVYPGAGPEEIETLVSKPLEDAIGSVNGLKNITSTSQEGVSIVATRVRTRHEPRHRRFRRTRQGGRGPRERFLMMPTARSSRRSTSARSRSCTWAYRASGLLANSVNSWTTWSRTASAS